MFEERARAQRQELVRDSAYAACNNDRVAGPDEFLARPRLAIKTMPNSLFPAFSHCPHYGCYSFGFRNPTDADSHETQLHPGERLQRLQISERRAKAASSLRASIAANAARVPSRRSSRPARSWKSIKRPMTTNLRAR